METTGKSSGKKWDYFMMILLIEAVHKKNVQELWMHRMLILGCWLQGPRRARLTQVCRCEAKGESSVMDGRL